MKLFLMALLAFSGAYAQTVNTVDKTVSTDFRVASHTTFGNRVYYVCDVVESAAKTLLETLGAKDVEVRCSGGLDPYSGYARDAHVKATYTVKAMSEDGESEGTYQEFEFKKFGSCHLYAEVLEGVKGDFDFERLDRVRTCFRSDDNIRITGSVLK